MSFHEKLKEIEQAHETLLTRKNEPVQKYNGIYTRYKNPILTGDHVPLNWRFDLNPKTNPFLMERIGINATMNSGAIKWNGKYLLMVRTEGNDRKSFFAVAERVPMALIIFVFGTNQLSFPKPMNPTQTCTTCD